MVSDQVIQVLQDLAPPNPTQSDAPVDEPGIPPPLATTVATDEVSQTANSAVSDVTMQSMQ